MRPARAGIDLCSDDVPIAPGQHFDVRQHLRGYRVGHDVGEAFLGCQHVLHATHESALVLHADEQHAPCRVGEGHHRAHDAAWRREVALELQGLALGTLEGSD